MKKVFLLFATVLFITLCNAQLKRNKDYLNGNNDTVWLDLSGQLKRQKTANGSAKIYTEKGKFDLYAVYKNKQVTDYYAIDAKGNKIPAGSLAKKANGAAKVVTCFKCTGTIDDKGNKTTNCWGVPCPKSVTTGNAAIKMAQ